MQGFLSLDVLLELIIYEDLWSRQMLFFPFLCVSACKHVSIFMYLYTENFGLILFNSNGKAFFSEYFQLDLNLNIFLLRTLFVMSFLKATF